MQTMADQEHENLVEKANTIISGSHVSADDKKLLTGRIPFIASTMLKMFVEVCEEDPFGVDMVVKSLKKKLDAQGNLVKLHEIIHQERIEIEDLASFSA